VDRYRRDLLALVEGSFAARESVQAILPFANTLKRPKGPEGKVRTGVYQGYRRYRPLLLTDRRLFIFETGRTPHGRGVLAEFSNDDVRVTSVGPWRFRGTRLVLDLPGEGEVPFDLGRRELQDLDVLLAVLGYDEARQ